MKKSTLASRLPHFAFCIAVAAFVIHQSASGFASAAEPPPAAAQEGVQLWGGGPYWADRNVGANEPWEDGYHFWWGDTVGSRRGKRNWEASDGSDPHADFIWFTRRTPTYGKDPDTLRREGWTTEDDVLAPEHDAARVQWGGDWRLPTRRELEDLIDKCDWTWMTTNDVNGYVVSGRGDYASASFFVPAAGAGVEEKWWWHGSAGFLWSGEPGLDAPETDFAWCLEFGVRSFGPPKKNKLAVKMDCSWERRLGRSVRPVRGVPALPTRPAPPPADAADDNAPAPATNGRAGVRLWEGGPLWADRNVGADEPWEKGFFFWWGDTVGYRLENDRWVAGDGSGSVLEYSLWGTNVPTAKKSRGALRAEGWTTNVATRVGGATVATDVLTPAFDAARAHWGGDWRMPMKQELLDLCYNKCDWTWTTTNGVEGAVVRGRGDYADAAVFLPATGWSMVKWEYPGWGFFWASDPRTDGMPGSWRLKFARAGKSGSDVEKCVGYHWDRVVAVPVRPVCGGQAAPAESAPAKAAPSKAVQAEAAPVEATPAANAPAEVAPVATKAAPCLAFGPDGTFAILHVTDVQVRQPVGGRAARAMREAIAATKPQMVVVTGDNVYRCNGREEFPKLMGPLVEIFKEAGVPFCVTFGNHDSEKQDGDRFTREEQYDWFKEQGGALCVDYDVPGLTGAGSGAIELAEAGSGKPCFRIFVMDCCPFGGWDNCRTDQIAWYERVAADGLPHLWFQHVMVPDVFETGLFREAKEGEEGGVVCRVHGKDVRFVLSDGVVGQLKEVPHATKPRDYRNDKHTHEGRTLYDAWRANGHMVGAYFGHDHMNSFDGVDRNGIRLATTKAVTTTSYNDGDPGVRLIVVHPDGSFETEIGTLDHPFPVPDDGKPYRPAAPQPLPRAVTGASPAP